MDLAKATPNTFLADNLGYGTIIDNDPAPPLVTISDVSKQEGNSGTSWPCR